MGFKRCPGLRRSPVLKESLGPRVRAGPWGVQASGSGPASLPGLWFEPGPGLRVILGVVLGLRRNPSLLEGPGLGVSPGLEFGGCPGPGVRPRPQGECRPGGQGWALGNPGLIARLRIQGRPRPQEQALGVMLGFKGSPGLRVGPRAGLWGSPGLGVKPRRGGQGWASGGVQVWGQAAALE